MEPGFGGCAISGEIQESYKTKEKVEREKE